MHFVLRHILTTWGIAFLRWSSWRNVAHFASCVTYLIVKTKVRCGWDVIITKDYLIQFETLTFYTFLETNAFLVTATDNQWLIRQMAMVCIADFHQIVEKRLFQRASNLLLWTGMISRLMVQFFFYLLFILFFHADICLQSLLTYTVTINEWNALFVLLKYTWSFDDCGSQLFGHFFAL